MWSNFETTDSDSVRINFNILGYAAVWYFRTEKPDLLISMRKRTRCHFTSDGFSSSVFHMRDFRVDFKRLWRELYVLASEVDQGRSIWVVLYQYTWNEKPIIPKIPIKFMRNNKIWKNKVYLMRIKKSNFGVKIYCTLDPKLPCIPYALPLCPTLVDRFTYKVLRTDIFLLCVIDSLCLLCTTIRVLKSTFQNF